MARWFAPPDGGYIPKNAPEFHGLPPKIPARVTKAPVIVADIAFQQDDKKVRLNLLSDGSVAWEFYD